VKLTLYSEIEDECSNWKSEHWSPEIFAPNSQLLRFFLQRVFTTFSSKKVQFTFSLWIDACVVLEIKSLCSITFSWLYIFCVMACEAQTK
jgi:hypothetical protein